MEPALEIGDCGKLSRQVVALMPLAAVTVCLYHKASEDFYSNGWYEVGMVRIPQGR